MAWLRHDLGMSSQDGAASSPPSRSPERLAPFAPRQRRNDQEGLGGAGPTSLLSWSSGGIVKRQAIRRPETNSGRIVTKWERSPAAKGWRPRREASLISSG